jgi:hypothetical protein
MAISFARLAAKSVSTRAKQVASGARQTRVGGGN